MLFSSSLRVLLAGLLAGATGLAFARLPPEVYAALERAKVPPEALVVVVQEAGSSRTRLAWRADAPVNPASLTKLLTTYAALDLLGPAWTWNTPVWLQGTVTDGVLDGNLVIKGSGDPKLVPERLWLLLRRVQQLGVLEIRGDIVLDRSAFNVPEQNPGDFDGEPLRPYNVRPDALLLAYRSVLLSFTPDAARGVALVGLDPPLAGVRADTSVPLTTGLCNDWRAELKADFSDPLRLRLAGSFPAACGEKNWPLAYADPRSYNDRLLAGLWREMGGKLSGSVRDGSAPAAPPSFVSVSPALSEVIREINKFSNNVMAQQLFLTLGLTRGASGSPEASREVLRRWLTERIGRQQAEGAVIDNGSGLSRETRLTAQQLARLLQSAWGSAVMPELMASLPVSGTDGTLIRSKAPAGRAHLKTGSLRDVSGVAGYVLAQGGRRYVVVAMINHPNANAARAAIDSLVQWVVNDAGAAASPPEIQN
jgi:D-alanyl-D-alanine carboxypeptidase/D-alanyl-D-alanine-endopeptidase (penicillin-binding protein 4)